ncbi:Formyl-coenzyme A transferase [Variovorax sp. PBL-E5]|nr:Formyl-coenzyme A transferase [Variovorax sp. PBL-E5]
MHGPLQGIRVVDVTTVMLGPYATQTLGDMGADVIKIEAPPAGDIARNLGAARTPGMSGSFLNMNRNKRSVAIDLKQAGAKEVLRRLAATADVFIHNMRPQAIERLGFGYEAVAALNPGIVYVGAYGFGQDGPYRAKPALDDAIQAASGLASLFVRQDGQPRYVPSAIADKIVGLTVSQAVLAALLHRSRTQEGQFVEVPMLETLVAFNLIDHLGAGAYAQPPGKIGYARASSPSRRPFPTQDGFVCILPYDDRQCRSFFSAVGRPEVADDARFCSYAARVRHPDAFYGLIRDLTPSRTTAQWVAICEAGEIPCMPVVDIEDLPQDEHLQAVGMFEAHQHPTEGATTLVRSPIRFSRSPASIRRHAPGFGEHSIEVLRGLDYPEDEIAAMLADGSVLAP